MTEQMYNTIFHILQTHAIIAEMVVLAITILLSVTLFFIAEGRLLAMISAISSVLLFVYFKYVYHAMWTPAVTIKGELPDTITEGTFFILPLVTAYLIYFRASSDKYKKRHQKVIGFIAFTLCYWLFIRFTTLDLTFPIYGLINWATL